MAYEGKSPDSDWIQMNPRTTEPDFPGTATDVYKEGTLFISNDSTGGATFNPPGLYVYIRDSGTGTTFGWQILTPNNNASSISSGNLGAEFGGVPCGTIIPFAKDVSSTGLPTGYLLCDGSSVSQTSFATLYTVTGVAFGDGTTGTGAAGTGNFNIPDFRGVFMRGMAHSSVQDPDSGTRQVSTTGGATGNNVGSYQDDAYEGHGHTLTLTGAAGNAAYVTRVPAWGYDNWYGGATTSASTAMSGGTGRTTTETRPKNTYIDYIIRYL